MKVIDRRINRVCLILAALTLIFLTGGQVGAGPSEMEKVIDPEIFGRLDQGETVDVIVLLKGYQDHVGKVRADEPLQMATIQWEIKSQQDIVLNRLDPSKFKLGYRFENILGFSGTVTQEGLLALAGMPEVELIEEDDIREARLAQGIPLMNASDVRSTHNGTGVSIAISDTGIDYNHSQLGGGLPNTKVIGGRDFADNDADPMDCDGHGTSVAGISAGTLAAGPGDYVGGVAHNAKLYALKISWDSLCGYSNDSLIAASWDWAVTHKNDDPNNPILIVNTSFGGGRYFAPCDASEPTTAAAADNLVANGITLFAASGNDGYTNSMGAPACVDNAISVGAVYDANIGPRFWSPCSDLTTAPDQVTCYSNSAYFLDLLAPSNDAYTTNLGGGYRTNFGGTSAASPYSAGAAAILQSYAKATTGSYYPPDQIRRRMVISGDPITDPKNGITKPRVNVGNAVALIEPVADTKANGSDGPVDITTGENLSVTVALASGDLGGDNADWWVVADTPFGWYYYRVSTDTWIPGFVVTYQGPLADLPPFEVLNMSGLSPGAYTFYFGVDMNMNGSVDLGVLFFDTVAVNVAP